MKIGKTVGGSSEWVIDNVGYVKEIKFYNAAGVWLTVDQGWLDHVENPSEYSGSKRVAFVEIDAPKRRIKLDSAMEKSENFYMKFKSRYNFEKDGVTLYIYMKSVSPDTVLRSACDLKNEYAKSYSIPILAVCDDATPLNVVKVIPRGTNIERKTEFGEAVAKMDDAFSLDGIGITGSDVAELMRLYKVERIMPVVNVVRDEDTGREMRELTDAEICKLQDERAVHRWKHGSSSERNIFTVSASFKTTHGSGWIEALQRIIKGD